MILLSTGCQHEALRSQTDLGQVMSSVNAEQLFQEGLLHARLGDSLRAEQYLSAARMRGYDEAEVVSWLVRVCVASNRYHSALAHAEPFLRRHPADWPLRFVVANIYDALGNVERAGEELEAVAAVASHEPLAQYRLAIFYSERSSAKEEARLALQRYLRLDPNGRYAAEARERLRQSEIAANARRPVRISDLETREGVLP